MSEEHSTLPPLDDESAFQLLQDWYIEKRQLAELKSHEHLTRVRVAEFYFPEPNEGTNRRPASPGFDIKLVYSYTYKVDEAALQEIDIAQAKKLKIVLDDLFEYKPQLRISAYRKLTPEQKLFIDALLDIKPGSPQLDIVPASQKEAEAAALVETAPQTVPAPSVPAPAPVTGGPQIRENMEDCEHGDYYQDGDGEWWIRTEGEDGWEQTAEPTHLIKPKPTRRGSSRKNK